MKFLLQCVTIALLIQVQLAFGDPKDNKIHSMSKKAINVLKFVKDYLPQNPIVLEAGAYNGVDTKIISTLWPKGRIHAFEPVPELYEVLKKSTSSVKNITCYKTALSDKKGTASFYVSEYESNPGIPGASGSLLAPKEHLKYATDVKFPKKITVDTITIDQWAKHYKIEYIDFMWLDMQGHELTALKHSLSILPTVKLIYTEVEFVKAYDGQAVYQEVKEWLNEQGFEVLAIDFNEKVASLGDAIPVGQGDNWYGNVLFIRKDLQKSN